MDLKYNIPPIGRIPHRYPIGGGKGGMDVANRAAKPSRSVSRVLSLPLSLSLFFKFT